MPDEAELTILFADLAGFTALTEAHGDASAIDCSDRFRAMTLTRLAPGARLVKMIGDAAMMVAETPETGVLTALEIAGAVESERGFPTVRIGVHTGSAIERNDDVFGAAVNLASRVAGHAGEGQILCTAVPAAAARRIEHAGVVGLGQASFKNVTDPVEIYEIRDRRRPPALTLADPVCKMRLDPASAAGRLMHAGTTYYFCSLECAAKFAQRPEAYAVQG